MRIIPGAPLRAHLLSPQEWGYAVGTDFWLTAAVNGMLTAGNGHELSDYGWTTTALTLTAGSLADFITSADVGTPANITMADASDLIQSPILFGNYSHALAASKILGYLPNRLTLEAYAAFPAVAANETATGFGFVESAGSPIVAGDAMAMIVSDGTNFVCRSGAASDVGATADTAYHLWRVEIAGGSSVEWFIDDTSQGTFAIQSDLWPVSFGAGVQAAGANDVSLAWVHIWYS